MSAWTSDELDRIGAAEGLDLASKVAYDCGVPRVQRHCVHGMPQDLPISEDVFAAVGHAA